MIPKETTKSKLANKNVFIGGDNNDRGYYYFVLQKKLAKAMTSLGYQVTYDEEEIKNCSSVLLTSRKYSNRICRIAEASGVPTIIFGMSSSDFLKKKKEQIYISKNKLIERADAIVSTSQLEKDFLLKNGIKKHIELVDIVLPNIFKDNISDIDKSFLIRTYKIQNAENIILISGDLTEMNQIETALTFSRTFPDCEFIYVGNNTDDIGKAAKLNDKNDVSNLIFLDFLRTEIYASMLANISLFINLEPDYIDFCFLTDLMANKIPVISEKMNFLADIFIVREDYIELTNDFALMYASIKQSIAGENPFIKNAYNKVKKMEKDENYKRIDSIIKELNGKYFY